MAGLRLNGPRSLALLHVLCVFRLLPDDFTNAVLRHHLAPLPGKTPDLMTSGQITDPSLPAPTALRAADRAYQAAIDDLTRQADLAA